METSDATPWAPQTISTYDKDDMVTLLVGAEEKELHAHGKYLSRRSDFFKAALKKEWTEGQTRTVKLPEEKAEVVAQYLDFVYDSRLPTDTTKTDCLKGKVYAPLTGLYALAERLLDTKIRNAIISEIIRFTTCADGADCYYPDLSDVRTIYECTTEASPARRLMVDLYASGYARWITSEAHLMFVQDLARALLSKLKTDERTREGAKVTAENYLV